MRVRNIGKRFIATLAVVFLLLTNDLLALESSATASEPWLFPVADHLFIRSPFGMRPHPITGQVRMHNGIDITPPLELTQLGVPVRAARSGVVTQVIRHHPNTPNGAGYGNLIRISHPGGDISLYAHLRPDIQVRVGQHVRQGDRIAYVGNSGTSTEPHLHFGIIRNGVYINTNAFDNRHILSCHPFRYNRDMPQYYPRVSHAGITAPFQGQRGIAYIVTLPLPAPPAGGAPSVVYSMHVQNIGWQSWVRDGAMAGTTGRALRVEGMRVVLQNAPNSGIRYRSHVQNRGWQNWTSNTATSGTSGQSLRVEAMQLELTGALANTHHVEYRAHVQDIGWMPWVRDGATAGTTGRSLRIEAMQIRLVPRSNQGVPPPVPPSAVTRINYQSHIQNIGWQPFVSNGATSGTSGRSLRMEAVRIHLTNQSVGGSLRYRAHVQNVGWQNWVTSNQIAGTTGRSLRVEAIQIELTGAMAARYHVEYRAHVQNIGWQRWMRNGAAAGTSGRSLRVEAIEIRLVRR